MIVVNEVTKKFDDVTALDRVSLHVKKGSVYGLIGPNGAGKTTLIKHLTGFLNPMEGSLSIFGEAVYENTEVKKKIAYISDDLFSFILIPSVRWQGFTKMPILNLIGIGFWNFNLYLELM